MPSFAYMFVCTAMVAPLAFTMLSYALIWRNDRQGQLAGRRPAELPAGTVPAAVPRYTEALMSQARA